MAETTPENTASSLDKLNGPFSVHAPAGNGYLAYTFETVPGTRCLGDGAFGNVSICRRTDDHSVVVAIKRAQYSKDEDRNAQMERALENEIAVFRLCRHPNILEYWGLSSAPDRCVTLGIVTSFMENGTMKKYLSRNPGANRHKLLSEVAAGLEYLHTPRVNPGSRQTITIVHGDIHSNNVLVTASGTAVLADFGMSEIVRDSAPASSEALPHSNGIALGIARYIAPELHDHRQVQEQWSEVIAPEVAQHADAQPGRRTMKADIFAFGMLMFETFGGDASRALEPGRSAMHTIVALIEGKRPAREDVAHPAFMDADWQLVQACWQGGAARRPSIGDIRVRLVRL